MEFRITKGKSSIHHWKSTNLRCDWTLPCDPVHVNIFRKRKCIQENISDCFLSEKMGLIPTVASLTLMQKHSHNNWIKQKVGKVSEAAWSTASVWIASIPKRDKTRSEYTVCITLTLISLSAPMFCWPWPSKKFFLTLSRSLMNCSVVGKVCQKLQNDWRSLFTFNSLVAISADQVIIYRFSHNWLRPESLSAMQHLNIVKQNYEVCPWMVKQMYKIIHARY